MHGDSGSVAGLAPGQSTSCHEPLAAYLGNRQFVSSTQLRRFERTGLIAARVDDNGAVPGTLMGEALHALVLEPEVFHKQFLVLDKACHGQGGVSEAELMQRQWLNAWQWSALHHARDALLAHQRYPLAQWLSVGRKELSVYWRDESGNRWKARPDCFTPEMVIDLKTTSDCRPAPFARVRERYGYDLQAAHYVEAVGRLGGGMPRFAFVAVELRAPYSVRVHELEEGELAAARENLQRLKQAYVAAAVAQH